MHGGLEGEFRWDEANVALLKARWGEQQTVNAIAAEMGISRNAVAGKLQRLGLMNPLVPIWTSERMVLLQQYIADGATVTQTANKLGIGRDTVRRKAKKLCLQFNPDKRMDGSHAGGVMATIKKLREKGPKREPVDNPKPLIPTAEARARGKSLLDLEFGECRFAYGDVGEPDFFFCAAEVSGGLAYCAEHARICYKG